MRFPSRGPVLAIALLIGGAVGVAGCFTTSADYQRDAEKFILTDDDLQAQLFPDGGDSAATEFTSVTCEDPESQDVGTTFICTAKDDAGGDWEFQIEIQGSNRYDVNVSRRP